VVERVGKELWVHAAAGDADRHVDVLGLVGQVIDVGVEAQTAIQAERVPGGSKSWPARCQCRPELLIERHVLSLDPQADTVAASLGRCRGRSRPGGQGLTAP